MKVLDEKIIDGLLSNLRSLGVKLWVDADRLRYSAPKGTLTPELHDQLQEHKAEIITFLETTRLFLGSTNEPIPIALRDKKPPLSFTQEGFWLIDKIEDASATYNLSFALKFIGSLNVVALEQSFQEIIRRHEVLRTTFRNSNEQPIQVISPALHLTFLPVIDLCALPYAEQSAEVVRLAREEGQQPFDLGRGPLLRATLLQLKNTEFVLLFSFHHIVSDAGSFVVFFRELKALYEAFSRQKPLPLQNLSIQYADFAVWQKQWLEGERLNKQMQYWKEKLDGASSLLPLPTDRPRPPIQTFRGERQELVLPDRLIEALRALSKQAKVTLYMTMLATFKILLYRYTRQEDIIVGSPFWGRNRAEIEGLIGPFINMLVMRTDLSGNPSFRELLTRVQKTCLGAYAHSDAPFKKLVEELKPVRDPSYSPIYQVMFILQVFPQVEEENLLAFSDVMLEILPVSQKGSLYDMTLMLRKIEHDYKAVLEYNTDLFDTGTATRMLGHLQILLEGIVSNPDRCLNDLPLLTPAEQHQLWVAWNQTQADYPKDACIHQLFGAQVEKTPDAVAIVFENHQLTYRELNTRSNWLAHHLQKLGVQPEVLVGICMERSLEMVIGLLAILKSGGAYVPLDPTYPQERLALILADAQTPFLLTQQRLLERLPQHQAQVICIDTVSEETSSQENPPSCVKSYNLAYVIYTSGSTGKPKGVQIPHGAVVNFLKSMGREPGITPSDSLLAVTSISFDIAALELYLPLVTGARIELVSREVAIDGKQLREQLKTSSATVMQATPATWQMLLAADWQGSSHLKILCGGEMLSRDLARKLLDRGSALWNLYGPTEATIWSTAYKVEATQLSKATIPIGRPIANTQIYLLDSHGRPVPIGVPGELHIGGAGLARGYLNRPALTAEKFVTRDSGEKLYKTGDLARYLSDGAIEYIERLDYQVKVRGFRIELGEIETLLNQHPTVQQAVVITREDEPGDKRLVAYTVSQTSEAEITQELRRFLADRLPNYMVPSVFVQLEMLPLTPNGKIDRRALPAPEGRPQLEEAYVMPKTEAERIIAAVWQDMLQLEKVGINDNFFSVGGHSLLLVSIQAKLNEILDKELSIIELFKYPTIKELAQYLAHKTDVKKAEESSSRHIRNRAGRQKEAIKKQKQLLKQRGRKVNG